MIRFLVIALAVPCSVLAQQLSPTDMIIQPRQNRFAISGIGGGNLYETKSKTGSSSGQISVDWNMFSKDRISMGGNDKTVTTGTVFRYNPVITTRLLDKDSLVAKKLPFVDNEYLLHFGLRSRGLRGAGDAYYDGYSTDNETAVLTGVFIDFMYTPYAVEVDTSIARFNTVNIHGGYQCGFFNGNSPVGSIGFAFSPQVDYLQIVDDAEAPNGFERSMKSNVNLPSKVIGTGFKFIFQVNDFAVFFEARKYWGLNSQAEIAGLTDRALISFGGVATGTAFRNSPND